MIAAILIPTVSLVPGLVPLPFHGSLPEQRFR
jgi:hypothetical protein